MSHLEKPVCICEGGESALVTKNERGTANYPD